MMDVSVYPLNDFSLLLSVKENVNENPLPCQYVLQYDFDRHTTPLIFNLLLIHIIKTDIHVMMY